MKDIIVVSQGNEIAYAKAFTDLLGIYLDDDPITSSMGKSVKAVIYSKQVYLHSSIPKKTYKMIIGNAAVKTPAMELVYNNNGMSCYVGNQFAKLTVDPEKVLVNYDSVFLDLEKKENEYFEKEAEYVERCGRKKSVYVEKRRSLFSKKWIRDRVTQAYLLLAYHFYLEILTEEVQE